MEHGKPLSATDSPHVDFDAVCQLVRAAVEPARAQAVSLHDERGDVLWLSESSMGPDEHNAVKEAIEVFSADDGPPVLVHDLGGSRSAVLLRAVNSRRALVGAIMVVMDARVINQDARRALRVMTPKLQRAVTDFAGMRPQGEPPPAPVRAAPAISSTGAAPATPAATARAAPPAPVHAAPSARQHRPRPFTPHRPHGQHRPRPGPQHPLHLPPTPGLRRPPHPRGRRRG